MTEANTETTETGSKELSTMKSGLDLTSLPERLDDKLLAQVKAISLKPLPTYEPCDSEHFHKCLRALSVLPKKADDDLKGKLRISLYKRKLGHYPKPALSYLVDKGLEQFDWFPSIKQCKAVLDGWTGPIMAKHWQEIAKRRVEDEYSARWRDLCNAVRDGKYSDEQINALPARTKQRLDNAGLIIGSRGEAFGPIIYRIRPSVKKNPSENAA